MIGLVTDSNSQLPADLQRRYGIEVVPLTVTVEGTDFLEGVELDADTFYAMFEQASPSVKTSQPSPGQFALAYEALAQRGATEIVSLHASVAVSGTVNSARLAAAAAPVPVRVVDTGTVSFGVSCCTWEAAEVLTEGGTADEAVEKAEAIGPTVGNVFVVEALDLARAGGRLDPAAEHKSADGIPVMSITAGRMGVVATATGVGAAADVMAATVRAHGPALRVGIGVADRGAVPLRNALEERLRAAPEVAEVVGYRIGPSVGAHTGPGTVAAMYYETV